MEQIKYLEQQYEILNNLYRNSLIGKNREYLVGIRTDNSTRHLTNEPVVIVRFNSSRGKPLEHHTVNKLGNPNQCDIKKYEELMPYKEYIRSYKIRTELPKFWCVKVPDDYKIKEKMNAFIQLYPESTKEWAVKQKTYLHFPAIKYCNSFCHSGIEKEGNYKEITIKDFERLVLNKKEPMEKTIKLTLEQARKIYGKSKEMNELLLANFSKEELEKPKLPTKWEDLKHVTGAYIGGTSSVYATTRGEVAPHNKNTFVTKKEAYSAIAMAQLSQLMKVYNGDWEADWNNDRGFKFCIYRTGNKISTANLPRGYEFLAFKTPDLRDKFLENFEDLIKEYFMID